VKCTYHKGIVSEKHYEYDKAEKGMENNPTRRLFPDASSEIELIMICYLLSNCLSQMGAESISVGCGSSSPYSSSTLGCGVPGGIWILYTIFAAPSARYDKVTLSGRVGWSRTAIMRASIQRREPSIDEAEEG